MQPGNIKYEWGIEMKHKTTLAVFAAVFIFSGSYAVNATTMAAYLQTSAVVQNPQRDGQDRDALKLTADQKKQLQAIHQSTRDQLMALRNDQSLSPEQRREKARTIREGIQQQVQGVLTPEQQQMVKTRRLEGRERAPGRGLRREFGPGNRDREALNLTTDQRSQLKAIHETTRDQVNAIRNDSTLTQEQKAEKLRSLHQSIRQQVSGILTPEQQQNIKEGRRGGPRGGRPGLFGGPHGRRGGFRGGLGGPSDAPPTQSPAKP